jgi:single-strand DNA-binding protein
MASLNKVLLIGNLTKDPEVRYTPGGKAVGDLRMAVNRRYKTAEGETKDETCFVSVVVWGKQAETCQEYLSKGSPLFVDGRLQYEEWEKDSQKFNRLRVVAERVQFLGSSRGGGSRDGGTPRAGGTEGARPAAKRAEQPVEDAGPGPGGDAAGADEDNLPF